MTLFLARIVHANSFFLRGLTAPAVEGRVYSLRGVRK